MSTLGTSLDRVDGPAKVTGKARYSAEFSAPRMLHAVLVQSTIASGRIAGIDTRAADGMPGVIKILTPANAPKLGSPAMKSPLRVLSLLQDDKVHYNGQPIAVVVAQTLEQATDAANHLVIRYSEAPARLDFQAGRATATTPPKANQHKTDVSWGSVDAALAAAAVKVDATYTTPSQFHHPLEPHATLAEWQGDRLIVHDATQGVFADRATLAAHFGIDEDHVRVISPYVGGGFGSKGSTWSHVVLCALAAKAVARPVKLVLDRTQMSGPVGGRPRTEQHIQLAANKDGVLTGVRHAAITQSSMLEDWVEPSAAQTRMLYATPSGDTTHRLVKLNVATPTFQRAPGEASGTFALEVAMDELAVALDLDPVELRLKNYADRDPVEGKPFSSKSLHECYRAGAERFGWAKRSAKPGSRREGDWLIGYGMATATYPANRSKAAATATLLPDGTAVIRSGTQDIGTGTYTVMTQVAADTLGLPPSRVRFELGDTTLAQTPVSGGSQTAASVATAVQAACIALREKLLALGISGAGTPLAGANKDHLETRDGWIEDPSSPSRREAYASVLARHGGKAIDADAETPPSPATAKEFALHSFGAAFAEVAVDEELGIIRLRRLHGTYDVGRRLNAKLAHSQLLGGIVWAASMALMEEAILDPRTGRIANANLADYHVPVNADIAEVVVQFVDSEDLHLNPLGIRGIGEIGITGMAAAIANAIHNATGKRLRDLPMRLDALIG